MTAKIDEEHALCVSLIREYIQATKCIPSFEVFGRAFQKEDGHWTCLPTIRELHQKFGGNSGRSAYVRAMGAAGYGVALPLELKPRASRSDTRPIKRHTELEKIEKIEECVVMKQKTTPPIPVQPDRYAVKPLRPKAGWGELT